MAYSTEKREQIVGLLKDGKERSTTAIAAHLGSTDIEEVLLTLGELFTVENRIKWREGERGGDLWAMTPERTDEEFMQASRPQLAEWVMDAISDTHKMRTIRGIRRYLGASDDRAYIVQDVLMKLELDHRIRKYENGMVTAFFPEGREVTKFWIDGDGLIQAIYAEETTAEQRVAAAVANGTAKTINSPASPDRKDSPTEPVNIPATKHVDPSECSQDTTAASVVSPTPELVTPESAAVPPKSREKRKYTKRKPAKKLAASAALDLSKITIDKNVPLPGRLTQSQQIYDLLKPMEVGDSVLLPLSRDASSSARQRLTKERLWKFVTGQEENGTRIWRTK